MLLIVIRILYAVICAGALAALINHPQHKPLEVFGDRLFLEFVTLFLLSQSVTVIDVLIKKKRIEVISAVYFGLLIGTLLANLLNQGLKPFVTHEPLRSVIDVISLMVMNYLCVSFLLQTKDDFRFIIPYIEFTKEVRGGKPHLLDTSAIIDGRIADLIETKIITAELIVPAFVLQELQDIADSSDKLRRNRGRRGLDVLAKLQTSQQVQVKLQEDDTIDPKLSVDQRLVLLAKKMGGCVVTNDFNLNKVASVQGVDVINLNDVANALKPRYLPGERLTIKIMKPGEGPGQGVGYLDDGTMVVCEEGNAMIGRDTDIVVKSVLQSSAGRMIFGRLPTHADR